MNFHIDYTTNSTLSTLSHRLEQASKREDTYHKHIDHKIKEDNLKNNLSLTIAHLLINAIYTDRSLAHMDTVLSDYNTLNGAHLKKEQLFTEGWMRIINDEVVLPGLVASNIRREDIENQPHITGFLRAYINATMEDDRYPWLTETKLKPLLRQYAQTGITLKSLTERGILAKGKVPKTYYVLRSDYLRYLRHEIAATLWYSIASQEPTVEEFRSFYRIVNHWDIWLDNLRSYLGRNTLDKMCDFAFSLLKNETDLLNSDLELTKIWRDMVAYSHVRLSQEIPVTNNKIDSDSAYGLIKVMEQVEFDLGPNLLDYQAARAPYLSLLRLITENDDNPQAMYRRVATLLKDISRPYIVWTLYDEMLSNYSQVLPYLLGDSELMPLVFSKLLKLEITLSGHPDAGHIERAEQKSQLTNELYLAHFDLALDLLAKGTTVPKVTAEILVHIVLDLANTVFSGNYSNPLKGGHAPIKGLYEEVLAKLAAKRDKYSNAYHTYPKFILSVMPELYQALRRAESHNHARHREYIRFSTGYLDFSVELLRLCRVEHESEAAEGKYHELRKISTSLTVMISRLLKDLFTDTKVDAMDRFTGKIEQIAPKRGVNEFGFEIIDWGYLMLHIFENNLFSDFHQDITASLTINSTEDKYSDFNREKYETARIYLKLLMLAYLEIINKREQYSLLGWMPAKAITELESAISTIAERYNSDDTTNGKIDIFNERYNLSGNYPYFQFLTPLLFKSINHFEQHAAKGLIDHYFEGSNDLGRMLTAVNLLTSPALQETINDRINSIPVEEFIGNVHTVTELQYALIEAVNSRKHWKMAKPLIERINEHFSKRPFADENVEHFLFEIQLVLAFKEKDLASLQGLSLPEARSHYIQKPEKASNMKTYYTALFYLYHKQDYDIAITQFTKLSALEPKNVQYAFQLYRAQTLKAINT